MHSKQIHIIVIAFVFLQYKQNSSSKLNQSCWQYHVDRLTQNYIPCLGQTRVKLCTLFRTETKVKNHVLSSRTSLYRPFKGVPPALGLGISFCGHFDM